MASKALLSFRISSSRGSDMSEWLLWLTVALLSLSPFSELRGGIPTGVALGLDPVLVFAVAVFFNAFVFLPVYYGLEFTYGFFSTRWDWVRRLVEGIRNRRQKIIERYGLMGIVLFVAIPLPITGAWTGTLLAWLFIRDIKRSWPAVVLGVLISGVIVMTLTMLGLEIIG
jgi:uncharacterized membrane protein